MSQLAGRWSQVHEVHLITWATPETDRYRVPPGVNRVGLDMLRPSRGLLGGVAANIQRVRRLRSVLHWLAPDFVLSFSDQMNIVALEASRRLDVPVWIAEHSDPAKQRLSRLWEMWRRRAYPNCDGCVVLTEAIAAYVTRWIPSSRVRVIPIAIDAPSTIPQQPQDLPLKTLLFVGRLCHEKGVDRLLSAWAQVHDQLDDWQLVIAGDGPLRPALEQQAGTMKRVRFAGWIQDPWSLYASADIFVLPSRYEGFPVALLEAMSVGVAPVATRCSQAIEQLLTHEKCLLDVRLSDVAHEQPQDLAAGLLELANNESLRMQIGQAAKRVAANYSWERIGPLWDAILPES